MNKNILISLCVIGAVAVLAIGGTIAYFNDTETSSGNTFTAGTLDLRFQADNGAGTPFVDVNGVALFNGNPNDGNQDGRPDGTFPLYDLKPGDTGERTVKLWVDGNHACGFIDIDVKSDLDNNCTEPEGIAEGVVEPGCTDVGELNDNVLFRVWKDNSTNGSCNNKLDEGESVLFTGSILDDASYSIKGIPNKSADAVCYGIAYCFGTWATDGKCDGSAVTNVSQSDSFSADLIIKAEQYRNQYGTEESYDLENACPEAGLRPRA